MNPFFDAALKQAITGYEEGGIPVGSVIVHEGKILGQGRNQRIQKGNPILHGEMDALLQAGRLSAKIYRQCTLYTTLSPCPMCSGAISLYRIPKVVVGENQNFMGDEDLLRSRGVEVEVLQDQRCISLMAEFIKKFPGKWFEDIGK